MKAILMKNKAAQQLGKRGGKARAASLSKEKRSEIARNAAKVRWLRKKWNKDGKVNLSAKETDADVIYLSIYH